MTCTGLRHLADARIDRTSSMDENAARQLRATAALPILHSHLAVMPDVHWGLGATIGSVIPTLGAIVPAAVGVDLGCGMRTWVRWVVCRSFTLLAATACSSCRSCKGARLFWSTSGM